MNYIKIITVMLAGIMAISQIEYTKGERLLQTVDITYEYLKPIRLLVDTKKTFWRR